MIKKTRPQNGFVIEYLLLLNRSVSSFHCKGDIVLTCIKDRQQSSGQIKQWVCIPLIQSHICNGILNNQFILMNILNLE